MKIAIPLDEDRRSICPSMGRAPYFLFAADAEREILPNPGAEAESGAGLQTAQFLVDAGTQVLVTPRCGENAAQVFGAADIQIFKSQGNNGEENVQAFREGRLEQLTHFHGGYHGLR